MSAGRACGLCRRRLASQTTVGGMELCAECVPVFAAMKEKVKKPARVGGFGIDAEMFQCQLDIADSTRERAIRQRGFVRPPTEVWRAGKDSGIETSWDMTYPDPRNER